SGWSPATSDSGESAARSSTSMLGAASELSEGRRKGLLTTSSISDSKYKVKTFRAFLPHEADAKGAMLTAWGFPGVSVRFMQAVDRSGTSLSSLDVPHASRLRQ